MTKNPLKRGIIKQEGEKMKERILNYVQETEKIIKNKEKITKERLEYHLIQIQQFQHERLIHLIVTVSVGTFAILFLLFGLLAENIGLLIAFIGLLCLFIPYILHYYLLENNVQKMYYQYDQLLKK